VTNAVKHFGATFRLTRQRGIVLRSSLGVPVIATAHPSSILRAPDSAARVEAFNALMSDLKVAAHELGRHDAATP